MSEKRRPVQSRTTSQRTRSAAQAQKNRAAAARRRKKQQQQKRLMSVLIVALAVLIVLFVLVVIKPFGNDTGDVTVVTTPVNTTKTPTDDSGSNFFGDNDIYVNSDGLNDSEAGSIDVTDLNVTPGLDETWENILLMGTDARVLTETSRSDTMIICSINKETGEIKLTSLMRDSEVKIDGKSRRLNSAYFYGGAKLAMRTVNECFGMNISKYVVVDFSAFATIAEKVGGIDIDVTTNEAAEINANMKEQYLLLVKQGKMTVEEAGEAYFSSVLESGGTGIHLNGMQTLGYARIRKLDSDFGRAERQRKVLNLLMLKLKGRSTVELMDLLIDCKDLLRTNLDINTIMTLGQKVLSREGFSGASTFVVPVQGTYKEEKRNDDAMLWDVDFETNKRELYAFIYIR